MQLEKGRKKCTNRRNVRKLYGATLPQRELESLPFCLVSLLSVSGFLCDWVSMPKFQFSCNTARLLPTPAEPWDLKLLPWSFWPRPSLVWSQNFPVLNSKASYVHGCHRNATTQPVDGQTLMSHAQLIPDSCEYRWQGESPERRRKKQIPEVPLWAKDSLRYWEQTKTSISQTDQHIVVHSHWNISLCPINMGLCAKSKKIIRRQKC